MSVYKRLKIHAMSIIHTTIDTKAITISISGSNGFTTPSHILFANALFTNQPTNMSVIKIKKAIKIPTISHMRVLTTTCQPLGLNGGISRSSSSMTEN